MTGSEATKRRDAIPVALLGCVLGLSPGVALAFDGAGAREPYPEPRFRLSDRDLLLTLNGELELEVHDVSGQGGPGHDSPTDTRSIGTRSPTAEIDALWLSFALDFEERVTARVLTEFTQTTADVGGAWAEIPWTGPGRATHVLQFGYHPPFIAIDRRTERYSLIATSYWREPELHVTNETRLESWDGLRALGFGVSVAMMRPITFASVFDGHAQRGTLNVIGYGPARAFSGNSGVVGAKIQGELRGAFATAFGYVGKLSAVAGTDELRASLTRFGDVADRESPSRAFYWYGGRVGYDDHGLHGVAEVIRSRESALERWGAYAQASVEVGLRREEQIFHSVEPFVRAEVYRIRGGDVLRASGRALRSPALSEANTWNWRVLTAGASLRVYRDLVRARVEYAWIGEENGVPALGIADVPLVNNELLGQLELRF